MLLLLWMLSVQNSSLWSIIIIIPIRVVVILTGRSVLELSGVLIIVYVIVFIGGLLVLLIRVTTIRTQEQGQVITHIIGILTTVGLLPFLLEVKRNVYNNSVVTSISWFEQQNVISTLIVLLLLLILVTKQLKYLLGGFSSF